MINRRWKADGHWGGGKTKLIIVNKKKTQNFGMMQKLLIFIWRWKAYGKWEGGKTTQIFIRKLTALR